jgi:hypothetical protein
MQTDNVKLPNLQTMVLENQKCISGEHIAADEVSMPI